jgi:WD40 repeat protein
MELKILEYIYHGKNKKNALSIFTIDFEPFGTKIITAGQDSLIKLWLNYFNFHNFFQKNNKKSKNLAIKNLIIKKSKSPIQIIETSGETINIVRWSPNGIFFASGGDDGGLTIYEKTKYPGRKNIWRIFDRFFGHSGEIMDLAWCPNSSFIISASLDKKALIWGIRQKCLVIKFESYSSWIKGIDWDISGKFIFTQSENKKIIIWKVKGWQFYKILNLKIKNDFLKEIFKINLFSRSKWSSCGNYLIICNFSLMEENAIFIFNRLKNFSNMVYLIGQKFLSRTIRCSGRIYLNPISKEIFSLFSLGSINGNLSIWNPKFCKPIVSLKNLTKDQILDISWSSSGYELIIATINGSVIIAKFNNFEIGKLLNKNTHAEFLISNCLNLSKIKKYENFLIFDSFFFKKKNIRNFCSQHFNNFIQLFFKKNKYKSFFQYYFDFLENLQLLKIKTTKKKIFNNIKNSYFSVFFFLLFKFNKAFGINKNIYVFFPLMGKKKETFIILKKKGNSIYKYKFFHCPIFIVKNKSLIFLDSKKKVLVYETKKKKTDFFLPKIHRNYFKKNYLKIIDCNLNSFILNFLKFTKLILSKIFQHYNFDSGTRKINMVNFFQSSGLLI